MSREGTLESRRSTVNSQEGFLSNSHHPDEKFDVNKTISVDPLARRPDETPHS